MGPRGRAPIYARIAYRMNRRQAAPAVARLIAMTPERVIFSHGYCYMQDGAAQLAASLHWLTNPN
jgi:hypothetical protein